MADVKGAERADADPTGAAAETGESSARQMTADAMKAFQELSANLARAAMIAQGALSEAAMKQASDQPSSMPADPFRIAPAMTGMMTRLASQPDKVMKAQAELFSGYMSLWQSTARRLAGEAAGSGLPEAHVATEQLGLGLHHLVGLGRQAGHHAGHGGAHPERIGWHRRGLVGLPHGRFGQGALGDHGRAGEVG